MRNLLLILRIALTALVAPLLPERFRRFWFWPELVGIPGLQTTHAFLATLAAFGFWCWGFVVYQIHASELVTAIVADDRGTGEIGAITHLGMVTYFAFFFTLSGALLTVLLLDGLFRTIAGAITGQVPGTLFLAVPANLIRLAGRGIRMARVRLRYGPASEPDRILEDGDGLRVQRSRPHPEWNAHLTVLHDGRFYALHEQREGLRDGRPCFEYRFKPWPDGQTLRRVVRLSNAH